MSEFGSFEWDQPAPGGAVYRNAANPAGGVVAYAPGTTVAADVWEELWEAGNNEPFYRLAVAAGCVWPSLTGI